MWGPFRRKVEPDKISRTFDPTENFREEFSRWSLEFMEKMKVKHGKIVPVSMYLTRIYVPNELYVIVIEAQPPKE